MRGVRLGLALAVTRQVAYADVVRLACLADELGYDSLWVPETWGTEAGTLLAALALSTRSLRLASGVFNVYSRSAALIAQTAATLQEMSGGRFVLGLGTSGPGVIERWHSIPFAAPLERTRDYVQTIRLALSGAQVDYEGRQVQMGGFKLANPPGVPVPIYIAALGPRNVTLAARLADGWLPIFLTGPDARDQILSFRSDVQNAGRDPSAVDIATYIPSLFGPRARGLLQQTVAYYIGGMGTFYADALRRRGLAQAADRISTHWTAGDRSAAVRAVDDDVLAATTLGRDVHAAASDLDALRSFGIGLPILTFPRGATSAEIENTIRGLAGR